jgi:hypothetical protein
MTDYEKSKIYPDNRLTKKDMHTYGYGWDGMLPLSKERALEFWHMDIPVFLLYPDDTEAQVDYEEDIENHDGMCGIEYDEWEEIAWQI